MVNESLKRRIQKLESESNRQKFAVEDIQKLLVLQCQRIDKLELWRDGEAL